MSLISRFKDIMESNISSLLDREEDPEKIVDKYLQKLNKELGKVKSEAASTSAEEQRLKRTINECQEEIEKLKRYADKASTAGNDGEARRFSEKKTALEEKLPELQASHEQAAANSLQMKQILEKLLADIGELEAIKREGF